MTTVGEIERHDAADVENTVGQVVTGSFSKECHTDDGKCHD